MLNLKDFYNRYHTKNGEFNKVILENNFTYFYILKNIKKMCNGHYPTGDILDVGCGVGTLAFFLSQFAHEVTGIDLSSRAITIAQKANTSIKATNLDFKNEELKKYTKKFDLILCTEVIEHIHDQDKFLSLIYDNLKQDGRLFLTTQSSENFLYRSGFLKKFDTEVGHVRRYTVTGLQKLLERHDFEMIAILPADGCLRMILYTTPLEFLVKFIRGPFVPLFHFFDRMAIKLLGPCDLQVIARKK